MASGGGYGGQSFGGWGGSSYGGSPFGARPTSFGGTRYQGYNPTAFGKASYELSPVPTQAPYGSSLHEPYRDPGANGVARGGVPFTGGDQNWLPGGGAFLPQPGAPEPTGGPVVPPVDDGRNRRDVPGVPYVPSLPTNDGRPRTDQNWYERGQGMPPTSGLHPGVGLPSSANPMMPVNRTAPPMQEAPQQVAQPAQRQAPAGYYFDQSGRLLAGMDPAQFQKAGTGTSTMFPSGSYNPNYWNDVAVPRYEAERQANLALPAPFGRYPDGTPMADPNRNFRADYRLQNPAFAGGWPGYTPKG